MKNKHASALGKLAKGKRKSISQEESIRRSQRMANARSKRWPKKTEGEQEECSSTP